MGRLLTLSLPFVAEINHLADMMLHVSGALHDHVETIAATCAYARIWLRPVAGGLSADGLDHYLDCVIQALQRFFL